MDLYPFHMDAVSGSNPGRFKSGSTRFRPDFCSHGDNKIRILCKYLIQEIGDVGRSARFALVVASSEV